MPPAKPASSTGVGPKKGLTSRQNNIGREQVSGIQRARMLAAMAAVACERGAGDVAVAHIVERAGVSRRTFYEIFCDREDCFLAAFDEALARISERMLPRYEATGGWRDRLRASLAALLGFLDDDPCRGRLLIVESLGAGPKALERRECVLDRIVTVVDEGREEMSTKSGGELPSLTAEGVVGAVFSVIHRRIIDGQAGGLVELVNPLMSIIVLPYLGSVAARKELERPVPERHTAETRAGGDPLRELDMRLTYRTVRVLMSVSGKPGSSNREIGVASGISDQGQVSKLLTRLQRLGLVHNTGPAPGKGVPNAWTLTEKGLRVERVMNTDASSPEWAIDAYPGGLKCSEGRRG